MWLTWLRCNVYLHGVDKILSTPWTVALRNTSTPWVVAVNVYGGHLWGSISGSPITRDVVLVLVLLSLVLVRSLPITYDVVFSTLSSYRWRCDTIAMLTLDCPSSIGLCQEIILLARVLACNNLLHNEC